MIRNREAVVTDAEGRYRVAVPADKQYTVSLQSIPGVTLGVSGVRYGATQVAEGVLEVRDLDFATGTEEIAGVVVDPTGAPVLGASVTIHGTPAALPQNWLGHHSESQSQTDASGRFHLRKVPKGKMEVSKLTGCYTLWPRKCWKSRFASPATKYCGRYRIYSEIGIIAIRFDSKAR